MKTVTGLFDDAALALRVGERVREVAGRRATVRVRVPGPNGSVVEARVVDDKSSYGRITALGVGLGLLVAIAAKLSGLSWGLTLLGFVTGSVVGPLLALWLGGELYRRRIESSGVLNPLSMVTATVEGKTADQVATVLREQGARLA